jgi:membrane associated rhomboid family serine protease
MSQPAGPPDEPDQPAPAAPVCYRHPDRETHIRCQRCERPICPDCMRQAPVGFQCPECVRQGARETRSARTAYGGIRSADPTLTSRVLVVANAAVWVLIVATGAAASVWVDRLALNPLVACTEAAFGRCVATHDGVALGSWWQLLTSAFTHVQVLHIGFNMLALWVLGPQLEGVLGRSRFLAVYLLSALAASACVMWLADPYSQTLGASGAVFGLMGALLVVVLKVRADPRALVGWIAVNFLLTLVGSGFISWQGHLGGFLGGAALAAVFAFAPRTHRSAWQWAGSLAFLALVLALIVVRVAELR